MKQQRHPNEAAALAAGQRRGRVAGLIGLAVGLLFVLLAAEFHAANCVLMMTTALMGGIMSGRAAAVAHAPVAGRAGRSGGTLAAFGMALPYAVFYGVQAATMTDAIATRMLEALGAGQATAIAQAGITPGLVYFQQQYVSYIGAYVIFAALLGQIGGWVGGLIGRRSVVKSATATP
ncbi:MAG TPA: hypothetical protein PLG23_15170 [Thermoflexales bacterium]|nr:hypothetical protein [Thermoflexales bacterium]HQY25175.1 hypothetical protein [Thermoflexales bacterium]HQZ54807.1 hypothetical protein [Thermoflexales bacterium]